MPRLVVTPGGFTGTNTVTVQVPDPAPGMLDDNVWQIQAVTFRVVVDATVQTRTPVLQVNAGDNLPIATCVAGTGVAASQTIDFGYVRGLGAWTTANNAFASGAAPLLPLDPGDAIVLSLANAAAADAVSRIHVVLAPFDY